MRYATQPGVLSFELPDAPLPDSQLAPGVGKLDRESTSCPSKLRQLVRKLIVLTP